MTWQQQLPTSHHIIIIKEVNSLGLLRLSWRMMIIARTVVIMIVFVLLWMMTTCWQLNLSSVMKRLMKFVEQLCRMHTTRRNNGECTAQAGINYVDDLSYYTRIADYAINLVEKVTEGVI
ncbi:Sodium-dependent phosphate transporter [Streptococcus thermophilus CNCM I-1630]|nr:Sodium-dependent phosphate transporter [Streptococcus thermophilus CNCM I-1630]